MTIECTAFAAFNATDKLRPWKYTIREPGPKDVIVEVHYCGICHSDIHTNRSEWSKTNYPSVTGHEFTGIVKKVGAQVGKCKVGDRVAIGCMVGSCEGCDRCGKNLEQFCKRMVGTYDSRWPETGEHTYGGYGNHVVCSERMILMLPESLPMDRAAPLLCAGITTYSPYKHYGIDKGGFKVGIVGLGGLGHMALQFGVAFGNEVHVIGRTKGKEALAKELGAKSLILSTDEEQMKKFEDYFDFLIDTVSADKSWNDYLKLLTYDGTLVTVGAPPTDIHLKVAPFMLVVQRKKIGGSVIGGVKETQEMLNFCAEKKILPMIELVKCDYVNEAYERVLKSDVRFRFVLDVKNSAPRPEECTQ